MKSIRVYLVVVLLSTVCLVNFLAALHGYRTSMAQADTLLDEQLVGYGISLAKLVVNGQSIPADFYGEDKFFQIWQDGEIVNHSSNAPNHAVVDISGSFHNANVNGFRWRVYVYPLDNNNAIVMAERYDLYTKLIERMVLDSILPIIWVLPLLALLIWLVVRFGLSGLKNLSSALVARKPSELKPLPSDKYPEELADVVFAVNQLLHRLEEAFEREQSFAADAAHELRTPLAAIKVSLHNLQQTQPKDSSAIIELNLGIDRMNHSIEQILSLYRLTPEKFQATSKLCNLTLLARNCIADMYGLCSAKGQTIGLEASSDTLNVQGDEFALMSVLRNLIDNASKYSPAGGEIRVRLNARRHNIELVVEDSGEGIPETDYQRVLNRFYRVGGDQHASTVVGSGLGLSIVEHIVGLHMGQINLAMSVQFGGLAVHIALPQVLGERQ